MTFSSHGGPDDAHAAVEGLHALHAATPGATSRSGSVQAMQAGGSMQWVHKQNAPCARVFQRMRLQIVMQLIKWPCL